MIAQLVIKEEEMETIEKINKVQKLDKNDVAPTTIALKVATTIETVPKKNITPTVDSKINSDTKIPPLPQTSIKKPDETGKL